MEEQQKEESVRHFLDLVKSQGGGNSDLYWYECRRWQNL